jgi:transcriptional regulator with XRE-family HTH domain
MGTGPSVRVINAAVNVARILQAMEAKQLKRVGACAVCGVNNKTLAKILRGELPQRIDAFYRVLNGLQIPFEEAVIAPTHKTTQRSRLYVVPNRRKPNEVVKDEEKGTGPTSP